MSQGTQPNLDKKLWFSISEMAVIIYVFLCVQVSCVSLAGVDAAQERTKGAWAACLDPKYSLAHRIQSKHCRVYSFGCVQTTSLTLYPHHHMSNINFYSTINLIIIVITYTTKNYSALRQAVLYCICKATGLFTKLIFRQSVSYLQMRQLFRASGSSTGSDISSHNLRCCHFTHDNSDSF